MMVGDCTHTMVNAANGATTAGCATREGRSRSDYAPDYAPRDPFFDKPYEPSAPRWRQAQLGSRSGATCGTGRVGQHQAQSQSRGLFKAD